MRCTCRSNCLTFNPETQSYEGNGGLVSKSTAANHRQDDLTFQALDAFTENVATQVLNYSPPAELRDQHPSRPGFDDQYAHTSAVHDQNFSDDFVFTVETEIRYRCTWAPVNRSLVFATDPPPTLPYRYPSTSEILTPNRGPYALRPANPLNAPFLENESRLCEILVALGRRPASDARDRLVARVYEGLERMERHKEAEWNSQRAGSIARHHGHRVVDTGVYNIWLCFHHSQTTPKSRHLFQ